MKERDRLYDEINKDIEKIKHDIKSLEVLTSAALTLVKSITIVKGVGDENL